MTNEQIKHLKELHEKATPGPWRVRHGLMSDYPSMDIVNNLSPETTVARIPDFTGKDDSDTELIVELRNSFPALIEELESLRRALDQAKYLCGVWVADDGSVRYGRGSRPTNCPDLAKALEER